ncbi:MAG: hypothetical protein ACRC6D_14625, partial [Aeromonas sp.]
MSLLPQGIDAFLDGQPKTVDIVGVDGFNVQLTGSTYTISNSDPFLTGTVLQSKSYKLVNTYSPTQPFSNTYNAASRFASVNITTLSDNSYILITPFIAYLSTSGGGTFCAFINEAGSPLAGCFCFTRGNAVAYSAFSSFGKYT